MKTDFNIIIERDPESGWLVGEVAELPGCHTQAPDMASLEANIQEAIVAYVKTREEGDEDLPEFIGMWRVEVPL